jgi:phospholipase/lecithinase/hemolysin
VRLYDAYGAIADMMKSPANYGFKEVNVLCWTVPACANDSLEGGLPVANTYVNWDGAHKTTRVHQLMAEQITQMVK